MRTSRVFRWRPVAAILLGVLLVGAAVPAGAAPAEDETASRILLLLLAAGEECREAVDDTGRVVLPLEIEEAKLLLAEAAQQAERLPPSLATPFATRLAPLRTRLAAGDPALGAELGAISDWLSAETGVRPSIAPPAPPSPVRGRVIYETYCVSCHGVRGAGDGADAARLGKRPANFTNLDFMRHETPVDFLHVVTVGRRLGAMPAWDEALSLQERWDAVAFIWSLSTTPEALAEGRAVWEAECARCHGATGVPSEPGVPNLTRTFPLAERTDTELYELLDRGVGVMPALASTHGERERWSTVAYVRQLSLGQDGGTDDGTPIDDARKLVQAAVTAYRGGDPDAGGLATDAYFRFEPVERHLGATRPDVVSRVERAFLGLRAALRTPGDVAAVEARAADVERALVEAAGVRESTGRSARFVQSALIILREGLEVVLIIGALLTWVTRTGSAAMRRPIWLGTGLGIVLSLATGALLASVLHLWPAATEVLEGAAMLAAAIVLFWVSHWMLARAEAERWQRWIRGQVERAAAAGRPVALAAAAFLAVYREGFETVLFYQALLGTGDGWGVVAAGFAAGVAALAIVTLVFRTLGLRLPLRPFFLATSAFLYAMAVVFAGTGVHELQEAGLVTVTPAAGVPTVAVLGIFPTAETLTAQALLLAGIFWGIRQVRRRRDETAAAPAGAATS